jgi:hypothetical protein
LAEDPTAGAGGPSEEEIRASLEEELRKLRVQDLLMQSVASIANLTARRIGKEDERDLEQARVGIDAVRALVDLLPEEAAHQVREALSQLQVLYAQAAGGGGETAGGGGEASGGEPGGGGGEEPAPAPQPPRPERGAGSEPPPRLWTPPGSS